MVVQADMNFIALMPVTAVLSGMIEISWSSSGLIPGGLVVFSQVYFPGSIFLPADRQVLPQKNQAAHQKIDEEYSCGRF